LNLLAEMSAISWL